MSQQTITNPLTLALIAIAERLNLPVKVSHTYNVDAYANVVIGNYYGGHGVHAVVDGDRGNYITGRGGLPIAFDEIEAYLIAGNARGAYYYADAVLCDMRRTQSA